ncbi:hypothetical protein R80B4_01582 [Fibrobacteres bacterium R8-0-B4]
MMHFDDHNPPNFHVKYNDYRAFVSIRDLVVLGGELPFPVLKPVMEWAEMHKDELMKNWEMIRKTGKCFKIEPLV